MSEAAAAWLLGGALLIATLLALSIIPLIVAIRHFNFERQRWSDSVYNPYDSED